MEGPREVPAGTTGTARSRSGPPGTRFGEVRWTPRTGSTNADLLALVRAGQAVDGLVLVTDHQTAGRGRQGRAWQDRPAGSLLVSVLVAADPAWASLIPAATGLAATTALHATCGLDTALKWPNDVLVPDAGERKVAGILAEAASHGDRLWVVVGMGCNLTWPADRPVDLADRLVAVADVVPPPARDDLLDAWLVALDQRLGRLASASGRAGLVGDYRSRCVSIGRRVRMAAPGGELEGVVEGVGDDGALLLRSGGALHRLDAGDVHHLPTPGA